MTSVSPGGTVALQWTSALPPGVVTGLADGLGDAWTEALALGLAAGSDETVGVECPDEVGPAPHEVTSSTAATTGPKRTR